MRTAIFVASTIAAVNCLYGLEKTDIHPIAASGTTAISLAFTHAELAMVKSALTSTHFRGSLGENIVQKSFLKETLNRTGNWRSITPRSGRQGFDHLFIKADKFGTPRQLIVGESKFGASQLGMTRDGLQMGKQWINNRLLHLSKRYAFVASRNDITLGKMPLNPNRQISVLLRNNKEVFFWRESSLGNWKFSGTAEQLKEARTMLPKYANFFKRAGMGDAVYRSRIFKILPKGNDLEIKIFDAKNIEFTKNIAALKQSKPIILRNALGSSKNLSAGVRSDMAHAIQTRMGCGEKDARRLATKLCKKYSVKELMTPSSAGNTIAANSAIAGTIATALDLVI